MDRVRTGLGGKGQDHVGSDGRSGVNTCSPFLPSLLVLVQDQKALVCAEF